MLNNTIFIKLKSFQNVLSMSFDRDFIVCILVLYELEVIFFIFGAYILLYFYSFSLLQNGKFGVKSKLRQMTEVIKR